jgi:hypothetical protein
MNLNLVYVTRKNDLILITGFKLQWQDSRCFGHISVVLTVERASIAVFFLRLCTGALTVTVLFFLRNFRPKVFSWFLWHWRAKVPFILETRCLTFLTPPPLLLLPLPAPLRTARFSLAIGPGSTSAARAARARRSGGCGGERVCECVCV